MATTTSITTTYAGEFAGKYIAAALLSAPTLEQGGVTIHPNVKYKQVIQKVATDSIVKNATCDFDATSTVTLTERVLAPEEFQVNLQLCKKDFPLWLVSQQLAVRSVQPPPPITVPGRGVAEWAYLGGRGDKGPL